MQKRILNIILAVILLVIVVVTAMLWSEGEISVAAKNTVYTVVVDAGHGGKDPGKVGTDGTLEKDLNLAISNELKKSLEASGIKVVLTRDDDSGLYQESDTNKKAADMKKRCELIESEEADVVVSIHQNSFTDSSVHGSQVFYYANSSKGKELAENISTQITHILGADNNRPIKSDNSYYLLLNTSCPTVIVECGFLSNPAETQKLGDPTYQKQLANAICQGVLDFLTKND